MLLTSKVHSALNVESLQPAEVQSLSKLLAQHGAGGSSRTARSSEQGEQPFWTLRGTAFKGQAGAQPPQERAAQMHQPGVSARRRLTWSWVASCPHSPHCDKLCKEWPESQDSRGILMCAQLRKDTQTQRTVIHRSTIFK